LIIIVNLIKNLSFVVFADDDTDGLCSARIIYKYLINMKQPTKVIFQKWDVFGVTPEDMNIILSYKPNTVFILDIGSDLTLLNMAEELLKKNISVIIMDNHPPDATILTENEMQEFKSKLASLTKYGDKFYYKSTTESCTTALVYDYVTSHGFEDEMINRWALIGIEGDVATDKAHSGPIFKELLISYPFFAGNISFQNKEGEQISWKLLGFFAQLLHIPRRIIYDDAPLLVFDTMEEMETLTDWYVIYDIVNKELANIQSKRDIILPKAKYPKLNQVIENVLVWHRRWKDVMQRGNNVILDYDIASISIIEHPWNVGSALANVRSHIYKKGHFVINKIPQKGYYISGRADTSYPIHIGKVFSMCDKNIIKGGGIKEAGSAKAQIQSIERIINELAFAIKKFASQQA
jgi:hypothetical protein